MKRTFDFDDFDFLGRTYGAVVECDATRTEDGWEAQGLSLTLSRWTEEVGWTPAVPPEGMYDYLEARVNQEMADNG